MVHENNELRHKVVYLGSRCEQIEAEFTASKDYLNSEIQKAKNETLIFEKTKMKTDEKVKELEKRVKELDLELIEAKDRCEDLDSELRNRLN